MKKILILTLLVLMICSPCYAFDEWTKTDTTVAVVSASLRIVDWYQTLAIADHPDKYYEAVNPIISKKPTRGRVNMYMASRLITDPIIAYMLPSTYRNIFQGVNIGLSLNGVILNFTTGIK
jgi:hypothetical protein